MESRYWPSLDRLISPLGFGCWQLGGEYEVNGKPHGWGHIDERDAVRLVQTALDHGIEFFDTAMAYAGGRSEEFLGKAISSSPLGHQAVICTKIPLEESEIAAARIDKTFADKLDRSLVRLKRDRVDVLLLHNPPDDLNWKEFNFSKPYLRPSAG